MTSAAIRGKAVRTKLNASVKCGLCLIALAVCDGLHGAMRPTPDYLKRATVYQIVLRNFTRDGNFKAATEMLDHVRSVGVDVVYLTPFVEMDRDMDESGWSTRQKKSAYHTPKNPYRISNYDKIDLEYGDDADFKAFNDKAHALGMKVYMDLVYLHCGPNNVLKDMFPDEKLRLSLSYLMAPFLTPSVRKPCQHTEGSRGFSRG